MGKLNTLAVGLLAFAAYTLHMAYDSPYDWACLIASALSVAWVWPDDYLDRLLKMDKWVRNVSNLEGGSRKTGSHLTRCAP